VTRGKANNGHGWCCGFSQELALFKNGKRTFSGSSGGPSKELEGDVEDLTGARVVTTIIVNGVPQTAIEVVEGVRKFRCALAGMLVAVGH
jgi:hypothetical protein